LRNCPNPVESSDYSNCLNTCAPEALPSSKWFFVTASNVLSRGTYLNC
jgi:hypothetical protein